MLILHRRWEGNVITTNTARTHLVGYEWCQADLSYYNVAYSFCHNPPKPQNANVYCAEFAFVKDHRRNKLGHKKPNKRVALLHKL